MAFPNGYGFYGSCAFCPCNKDCDQGKHCKIFTPLKRKKPVKQEKTYGTDQFGLPITKEDIKMNIVFGISLLVAVVFGIILGCVLGGHSPCYLFVR